MVRSSNGFRGWLCWMASALCLCFTFSVQAVDLTQAQVDAIVVAAQYPLLPSGSTLHAQPVMFPDGAKGEALDVTFEYPSARSFSLFGNWNDTRLYGDYCGSEAVVLATNVTNAPRLSSNKEAIITVSDFTVDRVLKGRGLQNSQSITVIREGGEVTDQGELLRIQVRHRPDFQPRKQYLLVLSASALLDSPVYLANNWITIGVSGGQLYPSRLWPPDNTWDGVHNGDYETAFEARLHALLAKRPCHIMPPTP
jgi:hypothetical protein